MSMTIRGIQEAQHDNERDLAELRPSGAFGRLLQDLLIELHRYTVSITHVITGALRASHRMELDQSRLRGRIFIDESSVRPGGGRPAVYGYTEHQRGGSHAFYERAVNEDLSIAFSRSAGAFVRSVR